MSGLRYEDEAEIKSVARLNGRQIQAASTARSRATHAVLSTVRRFVYLLWCPKGRLVYGTREGGAAWAGLASASVEPKFNTG